jgi:hypothetical protein
MLSSLTTLSLLMSDHRQNIHWVITVVYGPQEDLEKRLFIRELRHLKPAHSDKWLLIGDFNLIYKNEDKSNNRLDRRMMNRFSRALNHLEVKEIPLVGRRFTWSNQQVSPTMSRIDRGFSTPEWEELFANPTLQPLSSSASDHCPLLLAPLISPKVNSIFRFESYWVQMEGFKECVAQAWSREVPTSYNSLATLHIKLSQTAKAMKNWSKKIISHTKVVAAICKEIIAELETAQKNRQLEEKERN